MINIDKYSHIHRKFITLNYHVTHKINKFYRRHSHLYQCYIHVKSFLLAIYGILVLSKFLTIMQNIIYKYYYNNRVELSLIMTAVSIILPIQFSDKLNNIESSNFKEMIFYFIIEITVILLLFVFNISEYLKYLLSVLNSILKIF